MLKKLFIPLLLGLLVVAGAVYWLTRDDHKIRDLRDAVPIERFTLRNGLHVVVMPNHRIPAVSHILFVRAGGADDPYGKSGLAHYLEHLMFSGTKAYPEGEYDRAVNRVGGNQNAYTTRDYTAYYATVPKDALEQVMAMEADRLQSMEITEAHAAREKKVVSEERNTRVENSPVALFSEQVDAITFLNHPYAQPLIGWAEDIATYSPGDARQFFKRYYRASNMVLVVAGDVTVNEVRRKAQHYYGGLPSGEAVKRVWPKEPPLRLTRTAEMEDARAQQPRLLRQYTAPSAMEGDTAQAMPLALFTQYLGGGSTSLLYRQLVLEQKLANHVSASYDPLDRGPALVRIWAVPAEGVSLKTLERALDGVLEEALGALPDEADLARAKTQWKADAVYAQDGLTPLAQLIGQLIMIGKDEQYFYEWREMIDAVTAGQMLEAAQQVMNPTRRVTGYLTPSSMQPAMAEPEEEPTPAPEVEAEPEEDAQ